MATEPPDAILCQEGQGLTKKLFNRLMNICPALWQYIYYWRKMLVLCLGGRHMTAAGKLNPAVVTEKTKITIEDPVATNIIARDLVKRMRRCGVTADTAKVLLCIGTDRSTGDCLGPLVGSKIDLTQQNFFAVYGTLDRPVHASNLRETMECIKALYHDPFIIAVDACLGRLESVGYIHLGDGSLFPGAGVNKDLPPVGQIHITGIVNVGGYMEYMILQNTRLNLVMRLADVIVGGLNKAVCEFTQENKGKLQHTLI
jgi:putative sporulation protein YyaC